MTDYKKYISALRKCAKEHEDDFTSFGHIIVSDLCRDTANLLEELEQEPTTKNDLAVECISRADAIKAMQDKAKKLTNKDTINGLCGAVAILFDLPSVTLQEPCVYYDAFNKTCRRSEVPQESILDKIYADIQRLRGCSCSCSDGIIDDIENILDKYKAESEKK